jgi:serine/threonine protein kinase
VLQARERGELITVCPSQDIWALGVILYECLTEAPAIDPFKGAEAAMAMARGDMPYPWEESDMEENSTFARSRALGTVLACLSRNHKMRPTAAQLLAYIDSVGMKTTFASSDSSSDADKRTSSGTGRVREAIGELGKQGESQSPKEEWSAAGPKDPVVAGPLQNADAHGGQALSHEAASQIQKMWQFRAETWINTQEPPSTEPLAT